MHVLCYTVVDVEFDDILEAARAARRVRVNPWRALFSRRFAPQLVVLVALQVRLTCIWHKGR
jgi:hypothetical protein